jgi:hypothetical protein
MKSSTKHNAKQVIDGADDFDARQALRNGQPDPIGWYLEDAAKILNKSLLDPPGTADPEHKLDFAPSLDMSPVAPEAGEDNPSEWTGSPAQVAEAIANKRPGPLSLYLNELGTFLGELAAAFNRPPGSREWQVEFKRKGRGRRRIDKTSADSNILQDLRMTTRRYGKQEAAISDVTTRCRVSRSTIFRKKRLARLSHEI